MVSILLIGCEQKPLPQPTKRASLPATELTPDTRFLQAIAQIHQLLTNTPATAVTLSYQQGWQIYYQKQLVGTLSTLPDFQEAQQLLQAWANRIKPQATIKFLAVANIPVKHDFFTPLDTLQRIDHLWQQQSSLGLLQQAGQIFVQLCLQHLDYLENSQLQAKALALLIINDVYQQPLLAETALLANLMGYSNTAFTMTNSLPDSEIRNYLRQKDYPQTTSAMGKYLQLLTASYHHELNHWQQLRRQLAAPPNLAVLFSKLVSQNFALPLSQAEILPLLVTLKLALHVDPNASLTQISRDLNQARSGDEHYKALQKLKKFFKVQHNGLVNVFENYLTKIPNRGYFLNQQNQQDYYRGFFYSTLYFLALHELELQFQQKTSQFSSYIKDPTSPLGIHLQRWVKHLNHANHQQLLDLMQSPLGSEALVYTYRAYTPKTAKINQLLVQKLDSRPDHRAKLANIARRYLKDSVLTLRLANSIHLQSAVQQPYLDTWYLCYIGDWLQVPSNFSQPQFMLHQKLQLLSELAHNNQHAFVTATYQNLVNKQPDQWKITQQFSRYLIKRQQFTKAGLTIENWLNRNQDQNSQSYMQARLLLAQLLYQQQRFDDAWLVIYPMLTKQNPNIISQAGLILAQTESIDQGRELIISALKKFPNNASLLRALKKLK